MNPTKLAKIEPPREAPRPAPLALSVSGAIVLNGLGDVFQLARALANARGFVPRAYLGDENAIAAAILTGIELGIGPMEALRVIHMVDGKPTLAADYMLARAIRAGVRIEWEQCDDRAAVLRLDRFGTRHTHAFTIEEAQRAGLVGKDNWKKYPAAMLRARCIAAALRAFSPDVLGAGVYLAEELESTDDAPRQIESTSRRVTRIDDEIAVLDAPPPPALAPPLRLSDVRDEEELRVWCGEHRESLVALRNGRRKESQAKLRDAAARCGVDEREALLWAGLSDE